MGDVGFEITSSYGKKETVRLYEGMPQESDRAGGSFSVRGVTSGASYMSQEEYTALRQVYREWGKGDASSVRQELKKKRKALRDHQKNEPKERLEPKFQTWLTEYQTLLQAYGTFCAEHHVLLLQQMEKVKNAPEAANGNGRGYVPEWQSHWVMDESTEKYLEAMAESLNMQEEYQEGALMMKGHAGTGKDVLVKMYCERTHRPYFAMDCSKWTTEFELSEDIRLDSKEGASFSQVGR
jgi:hypothetical protein